MADKIILKNSSEAGKVPQPADLDIGELAVNASDGKVFTKKSDGTVTELSGVSGSTTPPSVGMGSAFDDPYYMELYSIKDKVGSYSVNIKKVVTNKNGTWYVANEHSGATSKSTDNGITWVDCSDEIKFYPGVGTNMYGASMTVSALSYGDDKFVYMRTQKSNSISRDNGGTWENFATQLGETPVADIYAVAITSGLMVAGGYYGYAARSLDDGATWEQLTKGLNSGSTTSQIETINHSTTTPGVVVAGMQSGYASRSADYGETWTTLPRGLNSGLETFAIKSIVCGKDGVWVAVGSGGYAARSDDDGVTWTALLKGLNSSSTSTNFNTLATDGNGVWIAAGDIGYAARSEDNGVTWTALPKSLNSGFSSTHFYSIDTDGSGVWVAVGLGGNCSRSEDNGLTWTTLPKGLSMNCVSNDIRQVMKSNDYYFIFADYFPLLRTKDFNTVDIMPKVGSVTPYAAGTDGKGVVIQAYKVGRVSRSDDDGETWTVINLNWGTSFASVLKTDGNGVWLAGGWSGYAARSDDNGLTWTALPQGIVSGNTDKIFDFATDGNGVWISAAEDGVACRSIDHGVTWTQYPLGIVGNPADDFGFVDTDGNGKWFISKIGGGILVSEDNGVTFKQFPLVADNQSYYMGAYLGDNKWVLVNGEGIFISDDNGKSWRQAMPQIDLSNGWRYYDGSHSAGMHISKLGDTGNFIVPGRLEHDIILR